MKGTSLIELMVALAVLSIVALTALSALGRLGAYSIFQRGRVDEMIALSVSAERLRSRLADARALLAPRAVRGARRAPVLVYLDAMNRPGSFFVSHGRLLERTMDPLSLRVSTHDLGACSALLFHDRGHSRRRLRIRLRLNRTLLATTVRLFNSPRCFNHDLPPAPTQDNTLHSQLLDRERRYFGKSPFPFNLLVRALR